MEAKRIDEFHKYGCHFYGKLVVVDYTEDLKSDPRMGTFNAEVTLDYVEKAAKIVKEKYRNPARVLLSIPEYVCEIE